ncbi:hypothetical protein [Oceanobacillus sp. CAU 1775]
MFWKFSLFELKLLIKNKKNWFIAGFLLLFFLLFFIYYVQEEPVSLADQKRMEAGVTYAAFEYLNLLYLDVPEVAEVREHQVEVQNLVNMQVWHIGKGDDSEQYIEDGLKLNEHRLAMHDLDNAGIPEHLITPREDILKEDAILNYIKDNDLPLASASFNTNHFVTSVLTMFSGLLFLVIVLVSGNEMLLYERRHMSVMQGFPLGFMRKVASKVLLYSIFVFTLTLLGFLIGSTYLSTAHDMGNFSFPILIYQNEGYIAVSTFQYLTYLFIGFGISIILILLLSILLNLIFKNAFANILIGLGIFFLPDIVKAIGFNSVLLHPIKFIDMQKVLSGDLAIELGNSAIDFNFAIMILAGIAILLTGIIYLINKYAAERVPKNVPIEKAF